MHQESQDCGLLQLIMMTHINLEASLTCGHKASYIATRIGVHFAAGAILSINYTAINNLASRFATYS